MVNNRENVENPTVKDILKILGVAGLITVGVVMPGVPAAVFKLSRRRWMRYQPKRFRQAIKRMQRTRLVSVREMGDQVQIRLAKRGKERLLRYNVDEIQIKTPPKWDGKWRLVIFDIPNYKRASRDVFREKLKKLGFYPLQESVFLHPFNCKDEIEFLRGLLDIQDEVQIHTISKLENEEYYSQFFDLD